MFENTSWITSIRATFVEFVFEARPRALKQSWVLLDAADALKCADVENLRVEFVALNTGRLLDVLVEP